VIEDAGLRVRISADDGMIRLHDQGGNAIEFRRSDVAGVTTRVGEGLVVFVLKGLLEVRARLDPQSVEALRSFR